MKSIYCNYLFLINSIYCNYLFFISSIYCNYSSIAIILIAIITFISAIISFCILNSISIFIFIIKIWDIMYLSNLYIGSNIIKVFKHWEKKLKLSILYEILDS